MITLSIACGGGELDKMEQEVTIDLREIWEIIKKRLGLIITITLLATIVSGVISWFLLDPVYETKSSIIIGKPVEQQGEQIQYNDVMMYQKLVKTYGEIAKSYTVAEKAHNALELSHPITLQTLRNNITVTPQSDTQIIVIKAESGYPEDAASIANTLTEKFIEEAQRMYPSENVQVMDKAQTPNSPIKPQKALNLVIAFVMGFMVSVGLAFLLEYLDTTIKTEKDIETYLGLSVIGTIPSHGGE